MPLAVTTITRKAFTTLALAADVTPRPDYSGRGMFGRQCVGIVTNTAGLMRFTRAVHGAAGLDGANSDVVNFARELEQVSSDDMGLSTIYYWPGVSVGGWD